MEIKQLKEINESVLKSFERLLTQLFEGVQLSIESLQRVVHSNNVCLFVAEEQGVIIGTLTLVLYDIPTGQKVWIEDVVVDQSARGKGVGRKLVQHAIEYSREMGCKKVDLTSSYDRLTAIGMYKSMGFEKRTTDVYRLIL